MTASTVRKECRSVFLLHDSYIHTLGSEVGLETGVKPVLLYKNSKVVL
jgi:hypothetical protein